MKEKVGLASQSEACMYGVFDVSAFGRARLSRWSDPEGSYKPTDKGCTRGADPSPLLVLVWSSFEPLVGDQKLVEEQLR